MQSKRHFATLASLLVLAACSPEQPQVLSAVGTGDLSQGDVQRTPFARKLEAACGPGGATEAGDESLLRMPYLQKVTTSAAELMWTSEEPPGACRVRVGEPGGEMREFDAVLQPEAATLRGQQYIARLKGLRAGTTHCYEVVCGGETWLTSTGFRTAPSRDSKAPVHFIALGDLGESTRSQVAVARRLAEVDYEFAIVTGDIAYPAGSLQSYEQYYFDMYAPLLQSVPFFVASGNHDNNYGPSSPFATVFSLPENGGPQGYQKWYSFDWGAVHIAVLDTERIGKVQAAWLDQDLAASDAPWKLVLGHRPPFSSGHHGNDLDVHRFFLPIIEKHDVPLTLWGHDHNYERTNAMQGVSYIVTGGGGRGSRHVDRSDFTAHSDPTAHFVHFTLDGDTLTGRAIDATGKVFDTMLVRRPGAPARPLEPVAPAGPDVAEAPLD